MDLSCPYKTFNKAFKGLLKDLKRTFPTMAELKIMYAGYKLLKSLNKKMVVNVWRDVIEDLYGDKVKLHDDTFFVDPAFRPSEVLSPMYAAIVPNLVETWKHLDNENKQAIWLHVDVLLALSQKCPRA